MSSGKDTSVISMFWEVITTIGRLLMWIMVAILKLTTFLLQAVENLFRVILK